MRLIYLAAPLSPVGDETVYSNLFRAKSIYETLSEAGKNDELVFIAPWILNCEVFEDNPINRDLGMKRNFAVIERCDELWLVGPRISSGMAAEAAHAARSGIVVLTKVKEK